jgi:DNA topoisomerase-1
MTNPVHSAKAAGLRYVCDGKRAIEAVAKMLGNTTAVCRKSYIHPAIVDAYMDGSMLEALSRRANQAMRKKASRLRPEETAVLAFLQQRLTQETRKRKKAA